MGGGWAVPRDSRSGVPEQEAASRPRRAPFAIQRARVLNPIKTLSESPAANGVSVKEESPPKGKAAMEWPRKLRFR
jgi:hypothetical protein